VRCPFLEQHPKILADGLRFSAQARIPDSLHRNSVPRQESVARRVVTLLGWMAMATAIGFNNQPRLRAVEIQCVFSKQFSIQASA
jgi:hypothetical protein